MNYFSMLSSMFGGKGEGGSCDTSGGEGECPCIKGLSMAKDKFDFDLR